jgi:ribosomal protein L39E
MKHAKIFSISVFVAIAIYGMVGFYFLPLAGFEGDLTRKGKLPESLFGWIKEQPAIDPRLMQQASWQDADVLAIGDSFSRQLLWQTALTRRGLRVRTETWEGVRNICADFTDWLRDMNFKGRYVVIEIIERGVEDSLDRAADCEHMEYHQVAEVRATPPATLLDRNKIDFSGKFSVGIQTKLHALKYGQLSGKPSFKSWDLPNEARMARLPDGCELFSHPRCNDVLFFADDHVSDFDANTLAKMEKINARLIGLIPIWVIVPDKSTVYLHPDKKFWDEAERKFHAPNILKTFRQAIQRKTIDLYRGNDTHLSTTGYLIMGDAVYQSMRR